MRLLSSTSSRARTSRTAASTARAWASTSRCSPRRWSATSANRSPWCSPPPNRRRSGSRITSRTQCVAYSRTERKPWTGALERADPRSLFDAIEKDSIFPMRRRPLPMPRTSGRSPGRAASSIGRRKKNPRRSQRSFTRKATVGSAPCLVVENSQLNGGQVHFYMETQACVAIPMDEGRISVRPSTQSPMEMHQTDRDGARRAISSGGGRCPSGRRRFRGQDRADAFRHRPDRRRREGDQAPGARRRSARRRHGDDRQAPCLLRPVSDRRRPRRCAARTRGSSTASS